MRFIVFILVSAAIHVAILNLYFVHRNSISHTEQVIIQVCEEEIREAPLPVPSSAMHSVAIPHAPFSASEPVSPAVSEIETESAVKSISANDSSEKVVGNNAILSVPVVIPPRLDVPPKPLYPISERKAGHEGSVFISVSVEYDGSLLDAIVKKGSGYKAFDRAALTAVRKCSFKPGLCNGVPCRGVLVVEVIFELK